MASTSNPNTRLCRACMNTKSDSLSEFSADLKSRFSFCTRIKVSPFDEHFICTECIQTIDVCYDFINNCVEADRLFKSLDQSTFKGSEDIEEKPDVVKAENDEDYDENILENDYSDDSDEERLIAKKKHDGEHKEERRKTPRIRICPICNVEFDKERLLAIHLQNVHPDHKGLYCNLCKKCFTTPDQLDSHVLRSHKKSYPCEYCPNVFSMKSRLAMHLKIHGEDKPFKCDKCEKRFTYKYNLVIHAKHHFEEKYLCDLCGKKFTLKGNLKVHMRIHTGEKPFACSVCAFRCADQSSMKKHEAVHLNQRSYACPFCEKSFNSSAYLSRHKRIHTGEKPYQCSHCSKAFNDNWKRKRHIFKTHNIPMSDISSNPIGQKRKYVPDKLNMKK